MVDLKKFRFKNNLSQKEAAEILSIGQSYYSDIENGKRELSDKMLFKLNAYLISKNLPTYEVNEDQEVYKIDIRTEEYEYQVSETNEIRNYERGDILRCKRIDFNEYIPTGIPYLFVTKINQIHVVRYLLEKQMDYMKISDTREGTIPESIPVSDIDKLFIIKEVVKKVND